jgi:hypothetical protein
LQRQGSRCTGLRHTEQSAADPLAHPRIQPNYLSAPEDLPVLREGVKRLREIFRQSAFDKQQLLRILDRHADLDADGVDDLAAVLVHIRNDGWLIELDAVALHIDQRVRRTQVDRHVGRHEAEQFAEHGHGAPGARLTSRGF